MDDFGTGYSSMSHLKRFSVGYVKIDRSFVSGLGKATNDEIVVSGMMSLGHGGDCGGRRDCRASCAVAGDRVQGGPGVLLLGATPTADGVETREQPGSTPNKFRIIFIIQK